MVIVFNYFFFKIFEKFEKEIFNCTILRNRFVRFLHLFCVRNPYVKNLMTIQIQSCIKLIECCVHNCPNCSGFDLCGCIKLRPAEHLVIIFMGVWGPVYMFYCHSTMAPCDCRQCNFKYIQ